MIDPSVRDQRPPITSRTLRQFAALWLVVLSGVAAWQWYEDRNGAAAAAIAAALTVGVAGLLNPERIRWLFVSLVAATSPIGYIVSRAVLALLFYGLFTPIAVVFRLRRRDALRLRRLDRESYWTTKPEVTDLRSYLRQS